MKTDGQERFNLYSQPGTEERQAELAARLAAFFGRYADPLYDRWKGGRTKSRPEPFAGKK